MPVKPQKNKSDLDNFECSCLECPALPDCSKLIHEFSASLGKALDARDASTKEHSNEVADISSILGRAMGLKQQQLEVLHISGHLHDIGKIGIPDSIIFKKEALNETEWIKIKKHPEIGAEIVSGIEMFNEKNSVRDIILCHHERFDGKGYPFGLLKYEIPLGSRIIAVADSVSAMMQDRSYRKRMNFDHVVTEVFNNSGTQFDPRVVNAFTKNLEILEHYITRGKYEHRRSETNRKKKKIA